MSTGAVRQDQAASANTDTFVTALVVNLAVAGVQLVAWIILRRFLKALYEPRTYIPPRKLQATVLGRHVLWPLWKIIWSDPEEILHKNGVDPYVFVRFLLMMAKAFVPIWFISWLILFPVNSVNTGRLGKDGLDRYTFGNVGADQQSRLWTHLILDYIFIFWIIYLIWHEMQHWLVTRQRYLISPNHSKLPQASTVLITGIPSEYMDEGRLEALFGHLPGGVKRIWLARNLKEMPAYHDRREKASKMLESAEVKLIKLAAKEKVEREKKASSGKGPAENGAVEVDKSLPLVDQLVPRAKRPTFRQKPKWAPFGLGWLGIGTKLDKVEWARKEIAMCTEALERGREQLRNDVISSGADQDYYPPLSSAFVHFNKQIAAHMAFQCLAHNRPYRMAERYIEQAPENVIWKNLSLNPYEARIRLAISYAITAGLVALWTFPVAFIGALSSISTINGVEWLAWLDFLNRDGFGYTLLRGVVSGILPPVLLALLMLLLPAILRQLCIFQGTPSRTAVELDVMNRYFVFLVIHTFFVVTLTSGLIQSIGPLVENPASVATILASQMPTASTFFITMILTRFAGMIGNLLQPISLLFYVIRITTGRGTPRSVYGSRYRLGKEPWGSLFPGITVYAVIVSAYMVISPVINGFGAMFFLSAYIVYKYLYTWVLDQPRSTDTGGRFFPKAINHVFVGMYVQEVCLCALFFLARDAQNRASSIPQGALMVVLIVITASIHYVLMSSYNPMLDPIPMSLAHISYGGDGTPEEAAEVQFGNKNDLTPFFGSQMRDKVVNTGKGVLAPIAGTAMAPTTKIRHRGKQTFEKLKSNPIDREQESAYDRRVRERQMAQGEPVTPPNQETSQSQAQPRLPRVDGGADIDVSTAVVASSPTSPGKPKYPVIASIPENWSEKGARPPRPSTDTGAAGYRNSEIGQEVEVPRESDDGIPLTRLSSAQSDAQETQLDHDAEAQAADDNEAYFALPGGPGVRNQEETDGNDPDAFFPPATKEPQMILWLPKDDLGLCEYEIEVNAAAGVDSSCRRAILNHEGKVRISGPPPVHHRKNNVYPT